MPNIINPTCLSLPQQVEKNRQDILKILASNLEELTGLQFIPTNLVYQNQQATINGKFVVIRDDSEVEIDGVVSIPCVGENGIIVDASEDNGKIRISLDQSDRELFNFVQELVNRTTESDEIVFTSDMENFVSEALENVLENEIIYDKNSADIDINLGFTAGITSDISVNHDLSKYDLLIANCITNFNQCVIIVDLKNPMQNGKYAGYAFDGISNEQYIGQIVKQANLTIESDKQSFKFRGEYFKLSDNTTFTNDGYYIANIKGVILK